MFSFVDNRLINLAQWIVRQIELFTSYTRNEIGKVLLLIEKYYLVPAFIFTLLFSENFFGFFVLLIITLANKIMVKDQRKAFNAQKEKLNSVLPKEIHERIFERAFSLLLSSVFFFMLLWSIASTKRFDLLSTMMYFSYFGLLFFEYFLCTTSLPPGEKKKEKVEREAKKMSPQVTLG